MSRAPLQVAIDARMLQGAPIGGVGRYLHGLLPRLADEVDVTLLLDARQGEPQVEIDERVHRVLLPAPGRTPSIVWLEVAVAPWLRRFDGIFHGIFYFVPLTFRGRSVLTLHDLAPQLQPHDFRPLKRAVWRAYIAAGVRRARVVSTVSEFVRSEISEHFGLPAQEVTVAPDAIDPVFDAARCDAAPALAARLGLPGRYVVAIGGATRRGLPIALEAFDRVRGNVGGDVALAVLGQPDLPPTPGVVSVGRLSDPDWATLLAGAEALCYPTRYEGFGLSALEAMMSGTPVVAARVASLPEVIGDAGCWCDALTASAVAEVLERVLTDPAWQAERRSAGLARAAQAPGWDTAAAALVEAYRRAAG